MLLLLDLCLLTLSGLGIAFRIGRILVGRIGSLCLGRGLGLFLGLLGVGIWRGRVRRGGRRGLCLGCFGSNLVKYRNLHSVLYCKEQKQFYFAQEYE